MPKALRIAIRTLAYIIRTLLILALIAGTLTFAFRTAMNVSNIYILTTDGLQKRANVILLGSEEELEKYFTEGFLRRDTLLGSGRYDEFEVRNFDYKLTVEWAFAYPWEEEGTATVVERVVGLATDLPEGEGEPPPPWEDGRYRLRFVKNEEGRWYIDGMTLLEAPEPSNTMPILTLPPGMTPRPTPSPSPSPSPTPRP